jgi:hypothetical protein
MEQHLILLLLCASAPLAVQSARRTSLEARQKLPADDKNSTTPAYSYVTAWYNQTLDHFTFTTDAKFRQKYLINDTWWDRLKV